MLRIIPWTATCLTMALLLCSCKASPSQGGGGSSLQSELNAPTVAGQFVSSKNLTAKALEVTDKLASVSDKNALLALIQEMSQNYDSYPPDLQFVAAFYIPMLKMQSLLYRLDGIFNSSNDSSGTTHSFYVSAVKGMGTGINTFLPNQNWTAGFTYFTQPFAGAGDTNKQFANFGEFQTFLSTVMLPELTAMSQRIATIKFSYPGMKPEVLPPAGQIAFDNKVIYGTIMSGNNRIDPFPNGFDRFVLLGEAERKALLASISLSIHNLLVTCSLNLDQIVEFNNASARALGYDNSLQSYTDMEGLTSSKRASIMRSYAAQSNLFAVTNPQNLAQAFTYLKDAVNQANAAWNLVKARDVNDPTGKKDTMQNFLALNPIKLIPWSRMSNAAFENLVNVVNGDGAALRSDITGEVVQVNLSKFYTNPPANLADLLPITFDDRKQLTDGGITFRNFYQGTPLLWNYPVYANYIPSIKPDATNAAGTDLRPTVRILSQAWGGWMVAAPMTLAL